jgi:WD40 repeat protein
MESFQCIQTLRDNKSVVMSLLCWDDYLLSCSLDNTVKVRKTSSYVHVSFRKQNGAQTSLEFLTHQMQCRYGPLHQVEPWK